MKQNKSYAVFKQAFANKLIGHGATLLAINPNRNQKGKSVFIFKKDEKLKELLNKNKKQ